MRIRNLELGKDHINPRWTVYLDPEEEERSWDSAIRIDDDGRRRLLTLRINDASAS